MEQAISKEDTDVILPVYKDAYNKLKEVGFIRTGFKCGPILSGRAPLNALIKKDTVVYFYDLPRFYVRGVDNEYEVSLFIRGEFESFYGRVRV